MEKNKKEKQYFTFVVIPHSPSSPTISVKVPRWLLHGAMFVVVASAVFLFSSFIYTSHVTRKLVSYEELKAKTQGQEEKINGFSEKTSRLQQVLTEIARRENQIRQVLGLKAKPVDEDINGKTINDIQKNVNEKKISVDELMGYVTEFRKKFAYTPSIWPIYGRIMSSFGYRISPWRAFHTGVDIQASYGTPIRCAACGTVCFVGWENGYGKTVIVDHGSGIKTLYGHLSAYAVKTGQLVKKGQRVAYVGLTGNTTGPHLHYEVRRDDVAINPMTYLNMSILSVNAR